MENLLCAQHLTQRTNTLVEGSQTSSVGFYRDTKTCTMPPTHTTLFPSLALGRELAICSSPAPARPPPPPPPGLQTECLTHADKMLGSRALAGGGSHLTE